MANKFVVSAMGKRVDFDALAAGAPKRTRQEIKAPEKAAAAIPEISGHRPVPAPQDDFASLVTVVVEQPKDSKEPRSKKAQAE